MAFRTNKVTHERSGPFTQPSPFMNNFRSNSNNRTRVGTFPKPSPYMANYRTKLSDPEYRGVWFHGISDLRKHQWDQTHLWDIRFENGPTKFVNWFPASAISLNQFNLETFDQPAGLMNFSVPFKRPLFELSVTFNDTVFHDVRNWVSDWVNIEIFGDTDLTGNVQWVAPLHDAVKKVDIVKLTPLREQIYLRSYYVFPTGALFYEGTSDSNPDEAVLKFVVAGSIKPERYAAYYEAKE